MKKNNTTELTNFYNRYRITDSHLNGLEVYGGSLYLRNTTIPDGLKLPDTIGGSLDLEGATIPDGLKLPKENAPINKFIKWGKGNEDYILADGRFSEVISKRGNIWKLKDIGKIKEYYLVTDGNGKYAHGDTIKEAKEDLIYKISNRDKSVYNGFDTDKKISLQEAVEMYRVITGACSAGVKSFIESKGITKKQFTVKEIAKITVDAYGGSNFRQFFNL